MAGQIDFKNTGIRRMRPASTSEQVSASREQQKRMEKQVSALGVYPKNLLAFDF
jgi:hypothetical protein